MDLMEKLPVYYRVLAGNYVAEKKDLGYDVNVTIFETCLRLQAEIFSPTTKPKSSSSSGSKQKTGTKPKKNDRFHGAHVEFTEEKE